MLAKAHSNIEKVTGNTARYYNMRMFNNSFSVGEKVIQEILTDESHKVRIRMKWTSLYTKVQVTAMVEYELKDTLKNILSHILP